METAVLGYTIDIDEGYIAEDPAEINKQLEQYERQERREFDLEITFPGSFTGRVMKAMSRIPYGETATYGDIAEGLGTSPVAVGQACALNPVPVIVPCHRVVSSTGLGGYQYPGLKRKLIELERHNQVP